jgi:hypothetical protein
LVCAHQGQEPSRSPPNQCLRGPRIVWIRRARAPYIHGRGASKVPLPAGLSRSAACTSHTHQMCLASFEPRRLRWLAANARRSGVIRCGAPPLRQSWPGQRDRPASLPLQVQGTQLQLLGLTARPAWRVIIACIAVSLLRSRQRARIPAQKEMSYKTKHSTLTEHGVISPGPASRALSPLHRAAHCVRKLNLHPITDLAHDAVCNKIGEPQQFRPENSCGYRRPLCAIVTRKSVYLVL